MGQYYKIVNLDRKEFLVPWDAGDGAKLLEFGSSGDGVMLCLAVLLADGNGRGGGDLCRTTFPAAGRYGKLGMKRGPFRRLPGERLECSWGEKEDGSGEDTRGKTFGPDIVGRWAGDRIAVVGDYADPGPVGTEGKNRGPWPGKDPETGKELNLYHDADGDGWVNVTADVLRALRSDGYLREYVKDPDAGGRS